MTESKTTAPISTTLLHSQISLNEVLGTGNSRLILATTEGGAVAKFVTDSAPLSFLKYGTFVVINNEGRIFE